MIPLKIYFKKNFTLDAFFSVLFFKEKKLPVLQGNETPIPDWVVGRDVTQ